MGKSKVIVITGGTGGIGYQAALMLASQPAEQHNIVVTGRRKESAETAVASLKEASGNDKIHYALADLSLQSEVTALAQDLMQRFPVIDELINNAGNLSKGEKEQTAEGFDKNFAVNVMAPLLLSRALVPALKKATPIGRVQITSGGTPFDTLNVADLEGDSIAVAGISYYSHSKRVMEAMALALARELDPIPVNVVGGGMAAGTSMTGDMSFSDMPWSMKLFYPIIKLFVFKDDGGKSAKKCAEPVVWAALAESEQLGTGKAFLNAPKEGKFKKEVADTTNQDIVMKYCDSKIIANLK